MEVNSAPGELRVVNCRDGRTRRSGDQRRSSSSPTVGRRTAALPSRTAANHQARPFEGIARRTSRTSSVGGTSFSRAVKSGRDGPPAPQSSIRNDDSAFLRIINTPRREIGTSIAGDTLSHYAAGAPLLTVPGNRRTGAGRTPESAALSRLRGNFGLAGRYGTGQRRTRRSRP